MRGKTFIALLFSALNSSWKRRLTGQAFQQSFICFSCRSKQVQLPSELCWMNFCVSFLPWIWHPSNIFVRNLSFLLSCLLFNENLPQKFPRKSREIGRFLREFVSSNPVKFHFFSRELSEALYRILHIEFLSDIWHHICSNSPGSSSPRQG